MKASTVRRIIVYSTSQKGKRPSNEDVEVKIANMDQYGSAYDKSKAPIDLFVVCDGHNGKEVSSYVGQQFENIFMNKNMNYPLKRKNVKEIYDKVQNNLAQNVKASQSTGSTCLTMIRYQNEGREKIQVFNVGDCRAVLCSDGMAIPLTKDHKPRWPEETNRIQKAITQYNLNDKIAYYDGDWRIHGLSVSRSFGDIDSVPYITHEPEIFEQRSLCSKDQFIVLACDGLWDVMENHEVVNFIIDKFVNGDGRENIALQLALYAIDKGSTDNVSVIIIKFDQ